LNDFPKTDIEHLTSHMVATFSVGDRLSLFLIGFSKKKKIIKI